MENQNIVSNPKNMQDLNNLRVAVQFLKYIHKKIHHCSIGIEFFFLKRKINKHYRKLGCNITAIYKQLLKVELQFVVANGQNRLKPDVCSIFLEVPTIASALNMCLDL